MTASLPTLVVLPGLDGTGRLLTEFADIARRRFGRVIVVSYPVDEVLDYAALERHARRSLPDATPFVLLAESFSGPIALSIAASAPPHLAALVLSTSFARNPVGPLRVLATWVRRVPLRAIPMAITAWLLLGRWATHARTTALRLALREVSQSVLAARAACALRVDAVPCLPRIRVPALYLQATNDRLIHASVAEEFVRTLEQADMIALSGPHMLLQANPDAALQAINDFVATRVR